MNADDIPEMLQEKVTLFNQRIDNEEKFAGMIGDKQRSVCIEVTDGASLTARLADGRLADFSTEAGAETDIRVTADTETLGGMLAGTVSPVKAYATRRLKVKCSVRDLLLLKRIF